MPWFVEAPLVGARGEAAGRPTRAAPKGRPYDPSRRANRAERLKQKPGTVPRPGAIGAIREFQFHESTDSRGRVNRSPTLGRQAGPTSS
jgi:hypothetical protein